MTNKKKKLRSGVVSVKPAYLFVCADRQSFSTYEDDDSKDWFVEGFASTDAVNLAQFSPTEKTALRVMPSALDDLVEWSKKLPTVFRNHDLNEEVGVIAESAIKDGKFWVKVKISKTRPDIWTKLKEGTLQKFSVSFLPTEEVIVEEPGINKPVRQIKHLVGLETSVVGLPMNFETETTAVYAESLAAQLAPSGPEENVMEDKTEAVGAQTEVVETASQPSIAASEASEAPVVTPATVLSSQPESVASSGGASTEAAAAVAQAAVEEPAKLPVEKEFQEAIGQAFNKLANAVNQGLPMEIFSTLHFFDDSVALSVLDDDTKGKLHNSVIDIVNLVAKSMRPKKATTTPAPEPVAQAALDLGAVKQSFEDALAAQFAAFASAQADRFKAFDEKLIEIQKDLADKAEAIGKLEKQGASILNMTVSGPNGAPAPNQVQRQKTIQELRTEAWTERPLFRIGW